MNGTVLIIEDNLALREMVVRMLKRFGYECLATVDGESGLQIAQAERPDVVLLDMTLPGKDGVTIVREFKAQSDLRNIPVIATTAQAMVGDRERFLNSGCDDYVSKPIDFTILQKKIQSLLHTNNPEG